MSLCLLALRIISLPVQSRFHGNAAVNVRPQKIERLAHQLHITSLNRWKNIAELLQMVFRIFPQKNRVHVEGIVEVAAVGHGKHRLAGQLDVSSPIARRDFDKDSWSVAHRGIGARCTNRLDRFSMGAIDVMTKPQHFGIGILHPRRMGSCDVA